MSKMKLEDLEAQIKDLQTKAKSMPVINGVHVVDGQRVAEWGDSDETATIVAGHDGNGPVSQHIGTYKNRVRREMKSLIKDGYKPRGEFKSFADFIQSGFEGGAKHNERYRSHVKAIQGMSESIGSDGGALVMPEYNNKIFEHVYANDLFASTDNHTVSGNNMTFLANAETSRKNGERHGGLRGYWVGEGQDMTKSKPTFREIQLKLQKLSVIVYLTDELISDSAHALENFVSRKASEEFNFMIGDAIFNGDGAGKPVGFTNSPAFLAISKEAGQASASILTENIAKMSGRFFAPNRGNAKWYVNQDTIQALRLMVLGVGTGGIATYMPPEGLAAAPYGLLDGSPLVPTEFNQTLGTLGDITLADLSQMISISKGGIAQAVSTHVEFLTDQLALKFTMRLNASTWENTPITPFNGTNTQSSFVGLATR